MQVKLDHEPSGSDVALEVLLMLEDYLYESHTARVENILGQLAGTFDFFQCNRTDLGLLARYHDIGKLA